MEKDKGMPNKSGKGENSAKILPFERSSEFYIRLAEEKRGEGEFADALVFYRLAAEQKKDPEIGFSIAETLSEMNLSFESNAEIVRAYADIETRPPEAWACMAENYLDMGENLQACICYQRCAKADPESGCAQDALRVLETISGAFDFGSFIPEADELFEDCPEYVLELGRRMIMRGRPEYADSLYNKFLEACPTAGFLYPDKIFAYLMSGSFDELIRTMDMLGSEQSSNDIILSCAHVMLSLSLGEESVVEAFVAQVRKNAPKGPYGTFVAAIELLFVAKPEEARPLAYKLVKYFPYNRDFLHLFAVCLYYCGDYAQAGAQYGRILKIFPNDFLAKAFRSRCKEADASEENRVPLPARYLPDKYIEVPENGDIWSRLHGYRPLPNVREVLEEIESDAEKIRYLREYLLLPYESSDSKIAAMRKLASLHVKPPYAVAVGQVIIEGSPDKLYRLVHLPESILEAAVLCQKITRKKFWSVCAIAVAELWEYYGEMLAEAEMEDDEQLLAEVSAAITLKAAMRCGLDADAERVAELYDLQTDQVIDCVGFLSELWERKEL